MEFTKTDYKRCVVVKAVGRYDSATAGELEKVLTNLIPADKDIVLDMSDINFVSSAGWWSIIRVQKELKKKRADLVLVALLARGHVLLEGLPGLAKTRSIKTLASATHMRFHRIQFTPDLLPSDVMGTLIYDPRNLTFTPKKGPVFCNLLLADEINRAPSKVQSALLEAMEERQVTRGDDTYPLPDPFLVLATQNPLEQEGTFPLPEAQMDRFLFKLRIDYPAPKEEAEVLMAKGEQWHKRLLAL